MLQYKELQHRLAQGWNTWNTRSVLSHVLLPEGFAVNLGIKDYASGGYLHEALIGRQGEQEERIHPGLRSYDGSYTELTLRWQHIHFTVQSATVGDDLVLLVTPIEVPDYQSKPLLVIEAGMLWNRAGSVRRDGEKLVGEFADHVQKVFTTSAIVYDANIPLQSPYLALQLSCAQPIGVSTGQARDIAEIKSIVAQAKHEHESYLTRFGKLAETYAALQTCLAWDTIYDPTYDRVISPVSRNWNCGNGGYILFCWDNYFAGHLAAIDNKALAYANVVEITREKTENGFVPNYSAATGTKSRDRSQPPVGATMVYEIFRRYGDRWLLEEVFDDLLGWNRWWIAHRASSEQGLLAWGSDPFTPRTGNYWELNGVNVRFGAALESGLDNSPMYDDIPFDEKSHQLLLADVGLNSLYIMDCRALAKIATVLQRDAEAHELNDRADAYALKLQTLWDEETGIFLNRRTDTGEFSHRLSPTNFYPLTAGAATPEQARRMIAEHFNNPQEFWGEWIMPSATRNDPAYHEQDYWRGRIWAPMNYLVYLGLRQYDLPEARTAMVEKSRALLLKEWREHGYVHENYCGDSGEGCNKANSDRFYHWGGLLGLISFIEAGYFDEQSA